MSRSAPRYDPRILYALRALDDRHESIAEVCRRVNAVLDELQITRVSYVHLRRLVLDHREEEDARRARRAALLRLAREAALEFALRQVSNPDYVARGVGEGVAERELVAQSHK